MYVGWRLISHAYMWIKTKPPESASLLDYISDCGDGERCAGAEPGMERVKYTSYHEEITCLF